MFSFPFLYFPSPYKSGKNSFPETQTKEVVITFVVWSAFSRQETHQTDCIM